MSDKSGFKLCIDNVSGRVVHIDEVPEGYKHAYCPDCKSPLVSSNNNKNTRKKDTYFRHKSNTACQGESLTHLWAKQIIAESDVILGAEFIVSGEAKDIAKHVHKSKVVQPSELFNITSSKLEKSIHQQDQFRIPDLTCTLSDNTKLAVEVYVSNAVSQDKYAFFEKLEINCLEINLSNLASEYLRSPAVFKEYVLYSAPRVWVSVYRYSHLQNIADEQAKKKAVEESKGIQERRDINRSIKKCWREKNSYFISLVIAYMKPGAQEKALSVYQDHLLKEGTLSYKYKKWFDHHTNGLNHIINIPISGELGFNCHRSVWQWEVYKIVVLKSFNTIKQTFSITHNQTDEAWFDEWLKNNKEWTPEQAYLSIKNIVPLNRITQESEQLVGGYITTERNKPTELSGLTIKEWHHLPKPICVIRRYLKELERVSILISTSNDTFSISDIRTPPLSKYY
jgi:hypothetical protein